MLRVFGMVVTLCLSGCISGSYFQREMTWYKADASEEELEAELEAAQRKYEEEHQRAMESREYDYDPSGTGNPRYGGGSSTDPGADSVVMVDKDEIVDRYMQAEGWVKVTIEDARRRREADELVREREQPQ